MLKFMLDFSECLNYNADKQMLKEVKRLRIDRVAFAAELARADINLKELSLRTGLSRGTITAVRSGKSCSEETARKISQGLCVSVETIATKEA